MQITTSSWISINSAACIHGLGWSIILQWVANPNLCWVVEHKGLQQEQLRARVLWHKQMLLRAS
jgi:hypothetical protein